MSKERDLNILSGPDFPKNQIYDVFVIGAGPAGTYFTEAAQKWSDGKLKIGIADKRGFIGGDGVRASFCQFRTLQGDIRLAQMVLVTQDWYREISRSLTDGKESESLITSVPYLFVARKPSKLLDLSNQLIYAQERGLGDEAELLAPDQLRQRFPLINDFPLIDRDVAGALFWPDAGVFDLEAASHYVFKMAKNTDLMLETTVGKIIVKKGKVIGVRTDKGLIKTETVVLANGPFITQRFTSRNIFGDNPALSPTIERRQRFCAPIKGISPGLRVFLIDAESGAYVRIIADRSGSSEGLYGWANPGQERTKPRLNPKTNDSYFPALVYEKLGSLSSLWGDSLKSGKLAVMPLLGTRVSGHYTNSPDGLPYISETPIKGLFIFGGLSHYGVMTGYGAALELVKIMFGGNNGDNPYSIFRKPQTGHGIKL